MSRNRLAESLTDLCNLRRDLQAGIVTGDLPRQVMDRISALRNAFKNSRYERELQRAVDDIPDLLDNLGVIEDARDALLAHLTLALQAIDMPEWESRQALQRIETFRKQKPNEFTSQVNAAVRLRALLENEEDLYRRFPLLLDPMWKCCRLLLGSYKRMRKASALFYPPLCPVLTHWYTLLSRLGRVLVESGLLGAHLIYAVGSVREPSAKGPVDVSVDLESFSFTDTTLDLQPYLCADLADLIADSSEGVTPIERLSLFLTMVITAVETIQEAVSPKKTTEIGGRERVRTRSHILLHHGQDLISRLGVVGNAKWNLSPADPVPGKFRFGPLTGNGNFLAKVVCAPREKRKSLRSLERLARKRDTPICVVRHSPQRFDVWFCVERQYLAAKGRYDALS